MTPGKPTLRTIDAASLVVGIIVGAGIYQSAPAIFRNVPDAATGMAAWALGAVLAAAGALCYAELATAYPGDDAEYGYFGRAFGPATGFAFAWAQLMVIRTGGSISPIAAGFGEYGKNLCDFGPWTAFAYGTSAIVAATVVNACGLTPGRRVQNALTAAKVLGLSMVIVAGFWRAGGVSPLEAQHVSEIIIQAQGANAPRSPNFPIAMVFVLFAYSGWHEVAYVSAAVRDPARSLPRAILLGLCAVAVLYIAVNAAYLHGLGLDGVRASDAVAADLLDRAAGPAGRVFVTALVLVTTLGAVNGMVLTGGRFLASFGEKQAGFAWMAAGRTRGDAPLAALAVQAVLSAGTFAVVAGGGHEFEDLVAFTTPVYWLFAGLAGAAVIVLRRRDPDRPRPFRVPLYPVVPAAFVLVCAFMVWKSADYARTRQPVGAAVVAGLLALGVPAYLLAERTSPRPPGP